MPQSEPTFVIKKDTKRPSGVVPSLELDDLEWISQLHRLWAIPFDHRDTVPRLDVLMSA